MQVSENGTNDLEWLPLFFRVGVVGLFAFCIAFASYPPFVDCSFAFAFDCCGFSLIMEDSVRAMDIQHRFFFNFLLVSR